MRAQRSQWPLALLGGLLLFALAAHAAPPADQAQEKLSPEQATEYFEKHVRPILVNRCNECHSVSMAEPRGGLRVDSLTAMLKGGDTGPAVVPGKPGESLLVDAINYGDVYQMPPKNKLPAEEIAVLTRWVEMGAPWAGSVDGPSPTAKPFNLAERKSTHWCWQPLNAAALPEVKNANWPRDPLDRYILAKLEKEGLQPAAPAAPGVLLRRVYFDLIGLPPTAAEVAEFEADPSSASFAKVVDRLLASPQFGERWGRHWLDLVRYAETRGHEFDYPIPQAFQYRDYVIRAFNADVPYDQLIKEHLAGDLVQPPRMNPTGHFNESVLATGFWYLGEWVHSPVDIRADEADRQDNAVDVVSKTFLGVTVSCARCHDHKFDAISQADYYALAGFLQSSDYRQVRFETCEQERALAPQITKLRRAAEPTARLAVAAELRPVVDKLDQYLLASRAQLLKLPEPAGAAELDPKVVQAWTAALPALAKSPTHPLGLFGQIAVEEKFNDTQKFAAEWKQQTAFFAQKAQAAATVPADCTTIIDYAQAAPRDWMVDGPTFGTGPSKAGDLLWTNAAAAPVVAYAGAARDPAWTVLRDAPGTRGDPSANNWSTAGKVLRTPTFTIEQPRVWALVVGAGNALAVVDSHRMIQGPLHGRLVVRWKDEADGAPRWVPFELAPYLKHRAHLEFAPEGDQPLQILRVVQSPQRPPVPFSELSPAQLAAWQNHGEATPAALAKTYQTAFAAALEQWSTATPETDLTFAAPTVSWMLRHRDLLTASNAKVPDELQQQFAVQQQAMAELLKQIKPESHLAVAMWDGSGDDEVLLIRGNPRTPGAAVPRRLLTALGGTDHAPDLHGSGRLDLAQQIAAADNPLTGRVLVNRVWHHLFGRGMVPSVDNMGVLGTPPSHPELLDHLALRFTADGWSIKKLIRNVVLSSTYQQASHSEPQSQERDPDNTWLYRQNIRRLEGEPLRDSMLAISGRLDRTQGGPSVNIFLTPFQEGRGRPASGPLDGNGRRSIYLSVNRNFMSSFLMAYDFPTPFSSMGRRNVSNVPAQSLILMNDPFVAEQARRWAKQILEAGPTDTADRVALMYRTAYARNPSDVEKQQCLAFLSDQGQAYGLAAEAAQRDPRVWGDLAHALFRVKEFVYIR